MDRRVYHRSGYGKDWKMTYKIMRKAGGTFLTMWEGAKTLGEIRDIISKHQEHYSVKAERLAMHEENGVICEVWGNTHIFDVFLIIQEA